MERHSESDRDLQASEEPGIDKARDGDHQGDGRQRQHRGEGPGNGGEQAPPAIEHDPFVGNRPPSAPPADRRDDSRDKPPDGHDRGGREQSPLPGGGTASNGDEIEVAPGRCGTAEVERLAVVSKE